MKIRSSRDYAEPRVGFSHGLGRFGPFAKPLGNDRFLRILFSSLMGQGREALPDVDAFGCLCSLCARSALDGVSWVQSG